MKNPWGTLSKNAKAASAALAALVLALGLATYAFRGAIFLPAPSVLPTPVAAAPTVRHPLTGLLTGEVSGLPHVFAVMIDHSADAWPQSGIDRAFLVIEAPVEAGIPRLEAFFTDESRIGQIGPVRSARPYFVDWANEFDALYVHVGGSDAALDLIGTSGTFDFNQFWHGDSFWRSASRQAPHNVYTSTDLLQEAVAKAQAADRAPDRLYGAWTFKDAAINATEGKDVSIQFLNGTYRSHWSYDETSGRYLRAQGNAAYAMADGVKVFADNVAVVITEMDILDSVGRRKVRTIGEGKAYVFQDGAAIPAVWKKPSVSERLAFFDTEGNPIAMNAGTTWIEIVESDAQIVF